MNPLDTNVTRTIALLSFAALVSMAAMRMCDPLLPAFSASFSITGTQAALSVSSFALAYGLFQLVYGLLGDRYGKLRVIIVEALLCAVLNAGLFLVQDWETLVLLRAFSGGATAGIIPLAMAWIGDAVPYERRQSTLVYLLFGTIAGFFVGQAGAGLFADTIGWRWGFLAVAAAYLAIGLIFACSMWNHERHAPTESTPFVTQIRSVVRIPYARLILLVVFIEGMLAFGPITFVPSYVHDRFGVSLTIAGGAVAAFAVGGVFYVFAAKRLLARIGEIGFVLAGGAALCAGFVVLTLSFGWQWAFVGSVIAGFGFYMLHNTLQTNATQMAPHARGTAMALFATSLFMGQSAGIGLGGLVMQQAANGWLFAAAGIGLLVLSFGIRRVLETHSRQTAENLEKSTG